MSPIPIAVIGCGHLGRYHAGKLAASETAELVAVDNDTLVAERAAARHGRAAALPAGDPDPGHQATILDRVHAAMRLQASGRSQALRNLLKAEQERGADFLRLAAALSALYPRGSQERRLLEAMLLAMPR